MGDGSLNPKTESGMLPALSNSNPYIITDIGLLDAASGPVWKAFDQVPVIGVNSVCSSDDDWATVNEYLNTNNSVYSKRGVMVDLGLGNEKCFDKFRWAHSDCMDEYFFPKRFLIQGSNIVGVNVADEIDNINWASLFKTYFGQTPEIGSLVAVDPVPDWDHGMWDSNYYCWNSSVKYRYYRIMFGAPDYYGDIWDAYNESAISEFRFIEEQVETSVTKLILHCNGDNNSPIFTDSSTESHTVDVFGDAKQTTSSFQLGTASAVFGSGEDYLSIADDDLWAIFNAPFTIRTFFRRNTISGEEVLFQQYEDYANYVRCVFDGAAEVLDFEVKKDGIQKIHLSCDAPFISGEWNHIAIVGNWENV